MAQRVINHCLNSAGKGPVVFSTETLRLRFGHLTANGKHWFAVSHYQYKIHGWSLAAAMFVFIQLFTSILAEKSCSKLRF